jgi:hypothetical protein
MLNPSYGCFTEAALQVRFAGLTKAVLNWQAAD